MEFKGRERLLKTVTRTAHAILTTYPRVIIIAALKNVPAPVLILRVPISKWRQGGYRIKSAVTRVLPLDILLLLLLLFPLTVSSPGDLGVL